MVVTYTKKIDINTKKYVEDFLNNSYFLGDSIIECVYQDICDIEELTMEEAGDDAIATALKIDICAKIIAYCERQKSKLEKTLLTL